MLCIYVWSSVPFLNWNSRRGDGVQLDPLDTPATNRPIVPTPVGSQRLTAWAMARQKLSPSSEDNNPFH
jgi:hypothetical protein